MTFLKKALLLICGAMLIFSIAACQKEGDMEKAGKKLDKALKEVGEDLEKAGEDLKEATEK